MKKIICFVLALVLTLAAVSAMAVSSKTNADLQDVKAEGATVTKAETVDPAVEAVLEDLDAAAQTEGKSVIEALPEEAKAALEAIKDDVLDAGEEFTEINEVVNIEVEVEEDAKEVILNMDLTKDFEENEKVAALIGLPTSETEIKWYAVSGIGQADGTINLIITDEELLNTLKANKAKLIVMIVE